MGMATTGEDSIITGLPDQIDKAAAAASYSVNGQSVTRRNPIELLRLKQELEYREQISEASEGIPGMSMIEFREADGGLNS